jgi:2-methylcitrate dehydratase PrpD
MTLSRQLARRIRACSFAEIPAAVRSCGRLHLLDAIGVALASVGTGVGMPFLRAAAALGGIGAATILGSNLRRDAATAALINGGLVHGLEFDDTHTGSIVHGSAVLAPTALAAAQEAEASGEDLLRAYILGWEVLVRMGLAAPGGFQARGFQVTSVAGSLVAALQTAELAKLDENRTVAALGIALSQAAGVFEFLSNGSSVKSMHPGWAAHAGLLAARLAAAGLSGPETALEGRMGLFQQFADAGAVAVERFSASLATLGRHWHITEAAYKFLPCCHYLHPYVEALDQLGAVAAAEIRAVHCWVAPGAAPIICEPWPRKQAPASGHEARWSLPIVVAARLIDGAIGHATFAEAPSEPIRALARRVTWSASPASAFPQRFEAEVKVMFEDGEARRCRIDDVFGGATRPAGAAEVKAKFRANAALCLDAVAVASLEEAVETLEQHSSAAGLALPLAVPAPAPGPVACKGAKS